jgi:DNA-binding PadR family transcriptional regulator
MYRYDMSNRIKRPLKEHRTVARRRGDALELAVLGLLNESPMHGYELRKRVTGLLGWVLSYGSLYPSLRQMQHDGLLTEDLAVSEALAARSSRRGRVVYKLTAEGKERFASLVSAAGPSAWDDESFGVHFAFFGSTSAENRLRILEGRRSRLEERLEAVRQTLSRSRERLDSYTLELQKHGLESVEHEVRWLTELIDSERLTEPHRTSAAGEPAATTVRTTSTPESVVAPPRGAANRE